MSQISLIIPASIKADADTLAQHMGWADPGALLTGTDGFDATIASHDLRVIFL